MQIGMVGLGRMGSNMVRRLMRGGHECVVYDVNEKTVKKLADEGATPAGSLEALRDALKAPRHVWVMVPAGEITEKTIDSLGELLEKDDVIVDGGNSHFVHDAPRAKRLGRRGIHYVDAGTSGGVWGIDRGYCLMIGGESAVVERLDPVFRTLAPGVGDVERTEGRKGEIARAEQGYLHCGPVGAGHFVKMVHNGIEYGVMQAYAEGFDVLARAAKDQIGEDVDVASIAEVWRRGSVIGSWLLDLTAAAMLKDPKLEKFEGDVQDSGEGRWTIQAAVESGVPVPSLATALFARFRSREEHTYGEKVLSAMRFGFGGHVEPEEKE